LRYTVKTKTADYKLVTIGKLSVGHLFTYVYYTTEVKQKESVNKALNRMAVSGKIA
jgi:hypothetical protein